MKLSISTLKRLLFALAFVLSSTSNAQVIKNNSRYLKDYQWKIGISANTLDMNFMANQKPEGAKFVSSYLPTKVNLSKKIYEDLFFELSFTSNIIDKNNLAVSSQMTKDLKINLYDANVIFDLESLLSVPYFSPYIKAGIGHIHFDNRNLTSLMGGAGLNFYFADYGFGKSYRYSSEHWISRFGINLEFVARRNITDDMYGSNLQYSAGIFYNF